MHLINKEGISGYDSVAYVRNIIPYFERDKGRENKIHCTCICKMKKKIINQPTLIMISYLCFCE